jgi:zinc transporter, ZIP family
MNATVEVVVYGGLAGVAIPVGALLSRVEFVRSRWVATEVRHGVTAFGAGALLSAIALVLIPAGMEDLSLVTLGLCFFGGGIVFAWLDLVTAKSGSSLGLVIGMLADFIPECLALGALFLALPAGAVVLAVLIAVQNLPEAFGAYGEITADGEKAPVLALIAFALLAPLGPLAAWLGLSYLSGESQTIAAIMTFASGGILYVMFQDVAPKVVLKNAWIPPMGALMGFFVGIAGTMLEA